MMREGEAVVYKYKGLYKVEKIGTLNFRDVDRKKPYYTLCSSEDEKDKVYVPVESDQNIRKPISKEAAADLIEHMEKVEIIHVENEKMREQLYKKCVYSSRCEDWMKVLKTIYMRGKKKGVTANVDKKYQEVAEKALFPEFAYALNRPVEEVGSFLKNQAEMLQDKENIEK